LHNKKIERDFFKAALVPRFTLKKAPHFSVIAPSEAWSILQGASPCRVRVSHPPVLSVAPEAERLRGWKYAKGREQNRWSVHREGYRP